MVDVNLGIRFDFLKFSLFGIVFFDFVFVVFVFIERGLDNFFVV